ncbi:MAG: hypothetical protein U1C46_03915, partial [Bacteroidales bacterium]|nr:hypothetical protein [Bacteroidales bacterium]
MPTGTIAAIAIGLFVYIGLVFFFSYTVQGDLLASDPKVLLKISLVPELVVAGIWGATLSSALGSILAAPRILQATAIDKITPRFFAKGTRSANEPRNALLLTFLIAQAGILIGDLNVIARIVSIFFITTYGFLNLSAAFEAATSADFRPSFKTPVWVNLLGATACFLVMIKLDIIALVGATIILGLLFLLLKRKQLSLEGGDAWSSVWASLVKKGIQRLNRSQIHARNWRPNIIMFSGYIAHRPYLVKLGNSLAGTLGMVNGFELEVMSDDHNVKQYRRMARDLSQKEAVFYKHTCPDIYSGMDEIVRIYGFTGVEPNTVLMGWSDKKDSRERFERLINIFENNDISSMFLAYDYERGFGNNKTIDIWWRGNDRNLAYAINIIRHFTSSGDWKDAKVRLLIVINQKTFVEKTYRTLVEIIDRYRANIEIKVIDNSIDAYAWEDIVKKESAETDLTMISVSYKSPGEFDKVYNEVNMIKRSMGSLLLIKAGLPFEENNLGFVTAAKDSPIVNGALVELPPLILTKFPAINNDITSIDANGHKVLDTFFNITFVPCFAENRNLFKDLKSLIGSTAESLHSLFKYDDLHRRNRVLVKTKNEFYFHTKRILEKLILDKLTNQKKSLEEGINWYIDKIGQDMINLPNHLAIYHDKRHFKRKTTDNAALRF